MDPVEKNTLRSNQVSLVNDLEPKDILEYLYEDGIITENDVELISTEITRRGRCQALLSLLPRRGPTAYGSFTKALKETHYSHLLDQLLLPEDGISKIDNIRNNLNSDNGDCSCTCLGFLTDYPEKTSTFLKYLRKHCCLIFNNVEPKEITAYLYQYHALSEENCERIHSGVTRQERCQCLVVSLLNLTKNIVSIFIQSLEAKYMFIATEMKLLSNSDPHLVYSGPQDIELKDEADYSQFLTPSCVTSTENIIALDYEAKVQSPVDIQAGHTGNETIEAHVDGMTLNPGSLKPFTLPNKKLVLTFNHLSSLINQGKYETFERASVRLNLKFSDNADMCCLLAYLSASRSLFGNKMEEAKRQINHGFALVPKTSNPKYFTVELFTAKTRMYITQKKLNKLQSALDDVKQVIETDPIGCTGRAAGWLYMNDGRGKTLQMDLINLSSPKGICAYNMLFNSAKISLLKALANFSEDGGKDGPFGCGFALCRLAILLLRCGDNGSSMNVLIPSREDVNAAGMYIRRLEESSIPIPKILEVHLLIAKCDYFYRKGNHVRAFENATAAYDLAEEVKMMEFRDHAKNRVQFLKQKTPIVIGETTEEDHDKIMEELLDETDTDSKDMAE